MPDEAEAEPVLKQLSPEEQQTLARAIARVEWELLTRVTKRLAVFAGVAATAITIFGIASVSTIRSAIVESAAERIAAKADVRDEVVERATQRLQRVNKLLDDASTLEREVQVERNRALRLLNSDLAEIRKMTMQLEADLRTTGADRRRVTGAVSNGSK